MASLHYHFKFFEENIQNYSKVPNVVIISPEMTEIRGRGGGGPHMCEDFLTACGIGLICTH